VVQHAASDLDCLPPAARKAIPRYPGGGGASGGPAWSPPPRIPAASQAPVDHLLRHIGYLTHLAYLDDDRITRQLLAWQTSDG
jgi:hypothetical protein